MEQLSPPPPPHNPYAPQAQQTYAQQSPSFAPARKPNVIKRFFRFLLRRTMYAGVVIGRVFAPFKVSLAIILPLLAVVGVLTSMLFWERIAGPAPVVQRAESLPPSPEVEAFLQGQRTSDAEMMWNSLSPTFIERNNITLDSVKRVLQDDRLSGKTYLPPLYIGGVSLKSGGAMYFYLVNARAPSVEGNYPISFVFTVDSKGKIADLD